MKVERLTFLMLSILFLAVAATLPNAKYSMLNEEKPSNDALKSSSLGADYVIYENKTKFYAVNGKRQVEFESENFSNLINQVFSLAKEGAVIAISPGEYNVSSTVKMLKPLHVYAYGATFQINASLTPIAFQIGDKEHPIFSPHSLKGAKIINLEEKGKGTGILLYGSHFGVLEDLEIWFFNVAIHSKGSWDYQVKNCILRVNKIGLKLDQDDEGVNRSNHFRVSGGYIGCDIGIHITGNSENVIIDAVNICDSSELGAGVWIEHAKHTIIRECYFENNPNVDVRIGGENTQVMATQIEECFFLVKKTAIKIESSYYTRVEGCMAINDSGDDSALFIEMTEKAFKLIYSHNYVQNLGNSLFFGFDGTNIEID